MRQGDKEKLIAALTDIPDGVSKWDLDMCYCVVILRRYNGHRLNSAKALGISYRALMGYIGMLPAEIPPPCRPKNMLDLDAVMRALIDANGYRIYAAKALGVSRSTIDRYIKLLRECGHQIPASPKHRGDQRYRKKKIKKKNRRVRLGAIDYDQIS